MFLRGVCCLKKTVSWCHPVINFLLFPLSLKVSYLVLSMKFITVRTYDNYIEANLALSKLLDTEIHAFLRDEHTVTLDPLLSNAINGIKLVVPEPEAAIAMSVLDIIDQRQRDQTSCPRCASHEVTLVSETSNAGNWLSGLFALLTFTYPAYLKKIYHCDHCGFEFEELPEKEST